MLLVKKERKQKEAGVGPFKFTEYRADYRAMIGCSQTCDQL